jgi:hypothetical protein
VAPAIRITIAFELQLLTTYPNVTGPEACPLPRKLLVKELLQFKGHHLALVPGEFGDKL